MTTTPSFISSFRRWFQTVAGMVAIMGFITACAPVAGYLPGGRIVTVNDRTHTVRRSGETYTASMNGGLLQTKATEAEIYVGNLRAIRDATGCPVAMGSVRNGGGQTVARITCTTGQTAKL